MDQLAPLDRRRCLALALGLAVLPVARASAAAERLPAGWSEIRFPFHRSNRFTEPEPGVVAVDGARASSILYTPVSIDLAVTPVLAWNWRVEAGPPATDLSRRGDDDRALAVIVGFPYDPARATAREARQQRTARLFLGSGAPGRSLYYVWGGDRPRGAVVTSPYNDAHRFRTLRTAAEHGTAWRPERVDVAADYRRAFGEAAPRAVQLAISSDGDDSRVAVRAAVAGLAWSRA